MTMSAFACPFAVAAMLAAMTAHSIAQIATGPASSGSDAVEQSQRKQMEAGRLRVTIPTQWQVVSGPEESQVKAEIKKATDQTIERYRKDSGMQHPDVGLKYFSAARFPNRFGWIIIHEFVIPARKDYYQDMKAGTKQKLDWGLANGIFKKVLDDGIVTLDGKKVLKTTLLHSNGGRSLTAAYWSAKEPSVVTQVMVIQEQADEKLSREIEVAIASSKIK